jgi:hypothetical protein
MRIAWKSATKDRVHKGRSGNKETDSLFGCQRNAHGASMAEDPEIAWHREQIAKNRTILEELETGNTAGSDLFPETHSEIERLKAQIAQSELIVAADNKEHRETR